MRTYIFIVKRMVAMVVGFGISVFICMTWLVDLRSATDMKIIVKNSVCSVNFTDGRHNVDKNKDLDTIYYVTPTYPRPEQIPELIRLSHTLMHVPNLHWIVADDESICSEKVLSVIKRSGLPYTLISSPKPFYVKKKIFPRGVANRRAALTWLHEHASSGVLYFGDDDNTVDLKLFDEIRKTKKVSMFPVGLIEDYGVSTPIVSDGKVVAFFDSWLGNRKFPVDMAGFAVNLKHLKSDAVMPYIAGQEEDKFLVSLGFSMADIEPLANNCSKVMVWHTRTVKFKKSPFNIDLNKVNMDKYESFTSLLNELLDLNMIHISSEGKKAKIIKNAKYAPIESLYRNG